MNEFERAYLDLLFDNKDGRDWALRLMGILVDRATPMKGIVHHYENMGEEPYLKCNCPTCNRTVYKHVQYCSGCGQAIDWSEGNAS